MTTAPSKADMVDILIPNTLAWPFTVDRMPHPSIDNNITRALLLRSGRRASNGRHSSAFSTSVSELGGTRRNINFVPEVPPLPMRMELSQYVVSNTTLDFGPRLRFKHLPRRPKTIRGGSNLALTVRGDKLPTLFSTPLSLALDLAMSSHTSRSSSERGVASPRSMTLSRISPNSASSEMTFTASAITPLV